MKTIDGFEVSGCTDPKIIESLDSFREKMLASAIGAESLLKVAEANPQCPLLQIYAGILHLYPQEHSATRVAQQYFNEAAKRLAKATSREKLLYNAAIAWMKLDYEKALSAFTELLQTEPRDLLSLKFAEWVFYCAGQAYYAPQFLSLCDHLFALHHPDPCFLAIYSFALELNGNFSEAKETAEKAMNIELATPWAHHTLAHVYLKTCKMDEGIKILESVKPTWETTFPLLKAHNTWHLALFYLAHRKEKDVVSLFKNGIFGTLPNTIGEQIDAISLLWRMDMAGVPQDSLYQVLLPFLQEHPFEYYTGFNAAHFIYVLGRSGNYELGKSALDTMETYANHDINHYTQNIWRDINLPFCQFVFAFSIGDYKNALELGTPVIEKCFQLGGSDAQDELFLQTYLLCLLACKREREAVSFFNKYLSHYTNTNLASYWFSQRQNG